MVYYYFSEQSIYSLEYHSLELDRQQSPFHVFMRLVHQWQLYRDLTVEISSSIFQILKIKI
jgi:hypothetical protein